MTVTIKDVAARAGVSPKTVSRVMNGEQHVRPAVRDAVMQVVAELGYRPNAFARSLSSARSYLIGLFCDDPGSNYATAMQRGALARCRARHYHLLVEPLDLAAPRWSEDVADAVTALRLDGVILAPPLSQDARLLDRLDALGTPYICISPGGAGRGHAAIVEIDEAAAAHAMTRHLIALGHRTIGFVEGDPAHQSARGRREGFLAAIAEAGLPPDAARIVPGDFSFRAGLEGGLALLDRADRPSAIFASNDDMALGVSVAAHRCGLTVPLDLSIAGFDDAPPARFAWPPITTMRQPVGEMGATAIDLLIDPAYRSAPDRTGFRRVLDCTLIERESVAAPPAANANGAAA